MIKKKKKKTAYLCSPEIRMKVMKAIHKNDHYEMI